MKTLSIVIPVYNEQERLDKTFKALSELQVPAGLKLEKVIFVNDGSCDETAQKIKNQKSKIKNKLDAEIQIISYKINRGKGYAVKTGMAQSNSDYTLFCDADISTPLSELAKFVPFMLKGTEIIIGTRKNSHSTVIKHQPLIRELLGRCHTLLSNIVLNTWVTDFTCGFKAFSKNAKDLVFPKLRIDGWDFDSESLFLAKKQGMSMVEVPVVWSNDNRSKVNILRDLPRSFAELFLIRFYQLGHIYRLGKVVGKPAFAFLRAVKMLIF